MDYRLWLRGYECTYSRLHAGSEPARLSRPVDTRGDSPVSTVTRQACKPSPKGASINRCGYCRAAVPVIPRGSNHSHFRTCTEHGASRAGTLKLKEARGTPGRHHGI